MRKAGCHGVLPEAGGGKAGSHGLPEAGGGKAGCHGVLPEAGGGKAGLSWCTASCWRWERQDVMVYILSMQRLEVGMAGCHSVRTV